MRKLLIITKGDFVNLIKNPMWIFYATLFPVLLVAILGFLTKDNFGDVVSSYDYYGITLMLYGILMSGMTSANAFMEERIKKPNMRIIYAPGSVSHIYLSKILASFSFSFLFHLLDLLFLILFFHVNSKPLPQILIIFGLTELFAVTLGIMLCCIFKTEATTNQLQSIVINIIVLLGGLLFPLDGHGEIIRKISTISPAKWIVDTVFQMIYDHDFHGFIPTAIMLAGVTILMVIICRITFRKEDCIC